MDDDDDRLRRHPVHLLLWGVAALVAQLGAIVGATWPFAARSLHSFPSSWIDPYQALWVMKWNRDCLLAGRSPLICPSIHAPVGGPLGLFSSLFFQGLLFAPASALTGDDIRAYNLLWLLSLLLTGLGTSALALWATRKPAASIVAGILATLSTPVLVQAHGALELIQLGAVALFFLGWIRFVDRPDGRRLAVAVALYGWVALSSAYLAAFATFPAALFVAWQAVGAGPRGLLAWLRDRGGWLLAFGAIAAVLVANLYLPQIWAEARGYVAPRSREQFTAFRAPAWAYAVPTPFHALGRAWAGNPHATLGTLPTGYSYLGVVTLALMGVAAVRRPPFRHAGFWWAALGLMVVLSAGDSWEVAGVRVPLPGGWIRDHVLVFRSVRVPGRFNLLAAVCAAVIAGAGAGVVLSAIRRRGPRWACALALIGGATIDLAMPFDEEPRPALPACYAFLRGIDPGAAIVDAPQFGSEPANTLNAASLYWQSLHRLRTTGGYSGQGNARLDALITAPSPFFIGRLNDPAFLERPESIAADLVAEVGFEDYAWTYLTAHGLRFVVLHRWPGASAEHTVHLGAVVDRLRHAVIWEDAATIVVDREKLRPPAHPVILGTEGWGPRLVIDGRLTGVAAPEATLLVYQADPEVPLRFAFDGSALGGPRVVTLRDPGGRELARWDVPTGPFAVHASPPFRLGQGFHRLTLVSGGDDRRRPYRLRLDAIRLFARPDEAPQVAVGDRPTAIDEPGGPTVR